MAATGSHWRRLEGRSRRIDNFPTPTWDMVQAQRASFHRWPDEHLVLDFDGAAG
jgi:hypothetical protein